MSADGKWFELGTGEGLFLPMFAPDGTPLLQPVHEGSAAQKGKFVPWQGHGEDSGSRPSSGSRPGSVNGKERAVAAVAGSGQRDTELAMYDAKFDARSRGRAGSVNRGVVSRLPPRAKCAAGAGHAPMPVPALGPMSNSHDRAQAYMHEMRDALEDMGVDTRDDAYLNTYAPVSGPVDAVVPKAGAGALQRRSRAGGAPGCFSGDGEEGGSCSSRAGSRPGSGRSSGMHPSAGGIGRSSSSGFSGAAVAVVGVEAIRGRSSRASAAGRSPSTASAGGGGGSALTLSGAMVVNRSAPGGSGEGRWKEGPRNAIVPVKEWRSVKHGQEVQNSCSSGRIIDVSDRNILCMSVLGDKAVLGSADHGLKEVNVRSAQMLRNLYTQRCGHTEWVTSVSHCPDGRVISGAADSKLCLWNASGVTCVDMNGHLGSISRVRVDAKGKLAISSAYDRTLGVWDLRSKRQAAQCTGHNAPVLDFVWWDNLVASGDRSGIVKLWDTNHAENVGTLKGHKGHITAMLAMQPDSGAAPEGGSADGGAPCLVTGAQDGHIRVWDLRQKLNTFNMACHPGGAVNDLGATVDRAAPLLVSTGADGRLLVMEPRSGYAPLYEFHSLTEDFLYSLLVLDDVAFVGDGRGRVICFDLDLGQQRYELNAGDNAIRCIGATSASLICAGDDGNALIFDF